MLVSMTVRCSQCGHESDPRYRFCGMCGAKLPPPPPPPPSEPNITREPEPIPTASVEEPIRRVSGPSFLGLADEPTSSVTYLLQDDLSESHWGRTVVLILVLGALGFAGWHWRSNVRDYVSSRLAQKPNNNQAEQASNPAGPQSDSSSETAGQSPTTISPVDNNPSTQTPPALTPNGVSTPPAPNAASSTAPTQNSPANAANSQAASAPASPAPNSQPAPGTQAKTNAAAAPGETAADPGTRGGADTVASTDAETPAPAATTKRAKPKVKEPTQTDDTSAADALEIQGERYLYGTGVPVSCDRAQRSLQAAADQGSAKADSVLGTMYATGHCVNRDSPLAYRWFARALQQDPSNTRLERDLQVLWNQMTPDERQIAMRH